MTKFQSILIATALSFSGHSLAGQSTVAIDDVYCILEKTHFADSIRFDINRMAQQEGRMPPIAALLLQKSDRDINLAGARAIAPHLSPSDARYICAFYGSPAGQEVARIQLHIHKTGTRVPLSAVSKQHRDAYVAYMASPQKRNLAKVQAKAMQTTFFGEIQKP